MLKAHLMEGLVEHSSETIDDFLIKLSLEHYIERFKEEKYDFQTFLSLNDDDLNELITYRGERAKLRDALNGRREFNATVTVFSGQEVDDNVLFAEASEALPASVPDTTGFRPQREVWGQLKPWPCPSASVLPVFDKWMTRRLSDLKPLSKAERHAIVRQLYLHVRGYFCQRVPQDVLTSVCFETLQKYPKLQDNCDPFYKSLKDSILIMYKSEKQIIKRGNIDSMPDFVKKRKTPLKRPVTGSASTLLSVQEDNDSAQDVAGHPLFLTPTTSRVLKSIINQPNTRTSRKGGKASIASILRKGTSCLRNVLEKHASIRGKDSLFLNMIEEYKKEIGSLEDLSELFNTKGSVIYSRLLENTTYQRKIKGLIPKREVTDKEKTARGILMLQTVLNSKSLVVSNDEPIESISKFTALYVLDSEETVIDLLDAEEEITGQIYVAGIPLFRATLTDGLMFTFLAYFAFGQEYDHHFKDILMFIELYYFEWLLSSSSDCSVSVSKISKALLLRKRCS